MKIVGVLVIGGLLLVGGCDQSDDTSESETNSASTQQVGSAGFNAEASDDKAIAIADSVMEAMGGKENWDQTKIISWNFFGRRTHTWNKMSGRDRIDLPSQDMVIDMNVVTKEGTVMRGGAEVTQPDTLQKYLKQGYEMWVNDMYWLLMPYKLKDGGVTLNYMGVDTTQAGEAAHKLKLTFDKVGVTPENMYHVYVDTSDYLVRQWAFFPKADMDEPGFVMPWKDYEKHGNILISGNRGNAMLSDIKVMEQWPDSLQ